MSLPPSHPLIAPACCCIASIRPLVAPHSRPPFRAGWLMCCLSTPCPLVILSRRPLIVSSRQLIVALCLFVLLLPHTLVLLSCQLVVALPLLAPPSHPLVVLAIFASPSPCLVVAVKYPQTLPPPSNTTAIAAIEHYLYRPPPPQLPFIAVNHQHKPLSIAAIKR